MASSFKSLSARLGTPLAITFFTVIGLSGLMLFFKLGSGYVKGLHEWLGLVFIAAVVLHVVRNTKPFLGYLRLRAFWWTAALTLAVAAPFVVAGAKRGAKPKASPGVMALAAKAQRAQLPALAPLLGATSAALVVTLTGRGLTVPAEGATLEDIARASGRQPQDVLEALLAR